MSISLSALTADSTAIDVVGNNLANLNTTGFKASQVNFEDMMSQSMGVGTDSSDVGMGVGQVYHQSELQPRDGHLHQRLVRCRHPGRRLLRREGLRTIPRYIRAPETSKWMRMAIWSRLEATTYRDGRP